MKRKLFLTLLSCAAVCAAGALAACNTAPHEHIWNDGAITTPATCSATGIKTYSCNGCDETYTEVLPKAEHPHSDGWLKNDDEHWQTATCEHITERVNVGAHEWGDDEVVTAATCLKTGLKKFTCVCGLTKTEVIQKTDHKYAEAWSSDGDNHWRVCTTDGCEKIADEHAHRWGDGVVTTPATCQSEGVKTYTCNDCNKTKTETVSLADHDYGTVWTSDESSHFHACKTEGCASVIDRHTHSFGDWSEAGQTVKVCSECSYEKAAPHISSNGGAKTVIVGGGETAGLTLFTMGKGWYTVHCTASVNVTFTCVYYEWDFDKKESVRYSKEFLINPESNAFTVKLAERTSCIITAVSTSEQQVEVSVYATFDDKAPTHTHTFSGEWSTNANWHWHACTGDGCEEEQDAGAHEFNGMECTVCGYDRREAMAGR